MPGEAETERQFNIREAYDELRAKYRRERMPSDFIERFAGPVISSVDGTLASFVVGAGLITGTFADIYDLHVSVVGIIDPNAQVYLIDRRRGTLDLWYLGTAAGQQRNVDLHAPSFGMPLYAGLQGTINLRFIGAATGSFVGRIRAYVDHDGTETLVG